MVEAILTAAARVFVEDGLDGATTNRIAEVAGVSVGSLYQYFPNKQALASALLVQHVADVEALRPAALRGEKWLTLRERFGIAVRWQLDAHAQDPAIHETLIQMAPRAGPGSALKTFIRRGRSLRAWDRRRLRCHGA